VKPWIQFSTCTAIAGILLAATPNADDILAKARKALGGDAKLAGLKSLTATGIIRRMPGPGMRMMVMGGGGSSEPQVVTTDAELHLLLPDNYLKSTTTTSGPVPLTIMEGLSAGKGWMDTRSGMAGGGVVMFRNLNTGGGSPEKAQDQAMKASLTRALIYWTLNAPDVQFTYSGEAEAPDGKADVLDAKGPDDFAMRVFLDKESHLPLMFSYKVQVPAIDPNAPPVRLDRHTGEPPPDIEKLREQLASMPPPKMREAETQIRVSDYDKVNGIQLPKVIVWATDGKTSEEFEVRKYVVNPPLTPEKFRKEK
jgi:hypothetical protein